MLRIRLQRRGKKNYATYRVVVAEKRDPIKGKFLADLGFYNPHTNILEVKKDDVLSWLGRGAKPSNTLHNLFVNNGVIKGAKVRSWTPKKKKSEGEEAAAEAAAEAKEGAPEKKEESEKETKEEAKEAGPEEGEKKEKVD